VTNNIPDFCTVSDLSIATGKKSTSSDTRPVRRHWLQAKTKCY